MANRTVNKIKLELLVNYNKKFVKSKLYTIIIYINFNKYYYEVVYGFDS